MASIALQMIMGDHGGMNALLSTECVDAATCDAFIKGLHGVFSVTAILLLIGSAICMVNALDKSYKTTAPAIE